jgi:hypothetical protein
MTLIKDLADPRFWALFTDFACDAFRLETLQEYAVSYEEGPFRDYLDGKPRYTHKDQAQWAANVAAKKAQGCSMSRVHIIQHPLTEYVRFELTWPYLDSVRAGEDVRLIAVPRQEWPAALPQEDFWLFDSRLALLMRYGAAGEFLGAELTEAHETVARCVDWRDEAMRLSVPYTEFMGDTNLV